MLKLITNFFNVVNDVVINIGKHYKIHEINTHYPDILLPNSPTNQEKYKYVKRHVNVLTIFSVISFACVTLSAVRLYRENVWLYPFFILLAYSVFYFLFSLRINLCPKDFDLKKHRAFIKTWHPKEYFSVDIFLPTCGEDISVLKNTWDGVSEVRDFYPGVVNVYSLDDAHSEEVRKLAKQYKFHYYARPNKGEFKKAGNLRYGFNHSSGDFIAIFDADFRPRYDFLNELMPYFYEDSKLGIVQSPQYFEVSDKQNWLERGAGAVQELFYRAIQVSRQTHGGAICVGSNAIYRRKALEEIGGTVLIEHSEDVHTGFQLRKKGVSLTIFTIDTS